MDPSEPYVCTLDEASIKKAKDELNEDPKDRMAAVEALRKFLKEKNPHIICPTDTRYLLSFLRTRKFSQLEARNLLENHLKKKTELKEWFGDIDPKDPAIQKIFKCGAWLPLPKRDAEGRKVFIIRPGRLNVKKLDKRMFFRTMACFLYYIYLDEMTQVNGTVNIFDCTGHTMAIETYFSLDDKRKIVGMWQKSFPARIKAFHMYNLGGLAEFLLGMIKMIMSEKLQKRVSQHSLMESLYKRIPLECFPLEYLPDDYEGPHAGTSEELVDSMLEDMTSGDTYERLKAYSSNKWRLDESQRTADVPQASFRKLQID